MSAKLLKCSHEAPSEGVLDAAVAVLRGGGVIAYPTETLYGLGADALNPAAVDRVYEIKRRPAGQPILVVVAEAGMLQQVAAGIPETAKVLAREFWPGPLTLVLPARPDLPKNLLGGRDTIAVRVPGSALCRELSRRLGGPMTSTSANISGGPDLRSAEEILAVLGEAIDLVLDAGPIEGRKPSTIVDCTKERPIILREGAILAETLRQKTPQLDWS